jgi:hypothetical protein
MTLKDCSSKLEKFQKEEFMLVVVKRTAELSEGTGLYAYFYGADHKNMTNCSIFHISLDIFSKLATK